MQRLRQGAHLGLGAGAALVVAGCVWGPGTGFATMTGGTVETSLSLSSGRLDPNGAWKTNNGYLIRLNSDAVSIEGLGVALQAPGEAGEAGTGATFDPAKPPPGYLLCHNGHCDRADGALVPYAEIEAELARGTGATPPRTVLTLQSAAEGPASVPIGGRPVVTLGRCQPACALDQGRISRLVFTGTTLRASGTVQAAPGTATLGATPRAWTLALPLSSFAPVANTDTTIDRDQAARLAVAASFKVSDRLLDGIDWARLSSQGDSIALESDAATREALLANLANSTWSAQIVPVAP
jgi:hypothetical protein